MSYTDPAGLCAGYTQAAWESSPIKLPNAPNNGAGDNSASAISGGLFGLGMELYTTGAMRLEYVNSAARFPVGTFSLEREALKAKYLAEQTSLGRSYTESFNASRGGAPNYASIGKNAAKTNSIVNADASKFRFLGKAGIGATIAIEGYGVVMAPEDQRALKATAIVPRLGLAWGGAKIGAGIGSLGGPWGAGIGAFAGGAIGGLAVDVDAMRGNYVRHKMDPSNF